MKITDQIQQLFRPKPTAKEVYLSLTLLHQHVAGCVWSIAQDEVLDIVGCEYGEAPDMSWEKRIEAADTVLSTLQDKSGLVDVHKTVLGFAPEFLTKEGDIKTAIRQDIKRLTTMLDLKPVGFVNVETAIMFQIKHEEGVPASVILLHVSGTEMEVGLYRVGSLVGSRKLEMSEFVVEDVETAIKSFPDIEILPSRMILYGTGKEALELIKSQLLTHQWTSRANFLHYPTIDVFDLDHVARAVALAGASELTAAFVEEKTEETKNQEEEETVIGDTATVTAQQGDDFPKQEPVAGEDETIQDEEEPFETNPEDANVVPVAPESFGFHQGEDVLEQPGLHKGPPRFEEPDGTEKPSVKAVIPVQFVQTTIASIGGLFRRLRIPKMSTGFPVLPVVVVTLLGIGVAGLLYYLVPHATVTIGVVPNTVKKEKTMTISTATTAVDPVKFLIPGKKLEQSVTGEKTATVSGKKRVGDPAKGTVVIYNKAVASRTIKKGSVVTGSSLQFTLDADVEIASASESIGSITFGKANAAITASAIGEEGNLPAGTEFTFKDIASSILIARNDQAFAGGTSRETTVVSRADYDALVKALTDELVTKAKSDLLAGVGGGEKLLDQTIKTAVTSKTFTEELDQEAKDLHGKVTLTISGISYNEQDIKSVLLSLASGDVPAGYVMNEGRTVISVTNPVVKKDGSISVLATMTLVSLPNIDVAKIRKELAGKTIKTTKETLKNIQGVGSVELFFSRLFIKTRFPINPANIGVDVVVSQ